MNYFFPRVDFEYAYNGIVNVSTEDSKKLEKMLRNDSYVFHNENEWRDFSNKYIRDGQISNIDFEKGQQQLIIVKDIADK